MNSVYVRLCYVAAELCWTAADIGFLIKLSSWIGGSRNFQKHFYNSGDSVWVEDIILEETIEIDNQKTKNNWGIDTYPPFLPSTISIKDVFTSFHSQTFIRKYLQLQSRPGLNSLHLTIDRIYPENHMICTHVHSIPMVSWYVSMWIPWPWTKCLGIITYSPCPHVHISSGPHIFTQCS